MKKIISNFLVLSLVLNAQTIKAENTENLKKEEAITASQANNTFNKEEIAQAMNQKLNNNAFTQEQQNAAKTLAKKLQDYKITGWSFCIDPNFALIWDTQDPEFQVTYKNSQGETKVRNYESEINSIGLKLELDFKLDFIFFTNTDINFYDSNKEIELGSGFDLTTNIVDITYVSFENMPGGLIIIGFPLIQLMNTLTYPLYSSAVEKITEKPYPYPWNPFYPYPILSIMPSYVSGGHLKPIKK